MDNLYPRPDETPEVVQNSTPSAPPVDPAAAPAGIPAAPYTPQEPAYAPPAAPYAPPAYSYTAPQRPVYYAPAAAPVKRQTATGRDIVFAIITAILCILCADNYLWGDAGLGATLSTVCLLLTGIFYLGHHAKKVTFYGLLCVLAYFICAVSLSFTDLGSAKALVIMTMIPLSAAAILEANDLRTRTGGDFRNIADIFYAVFALTFGKIGNTFYALFHKKSDAGSVNKRRLGSVILGLLISLPALLIIIPLLKSSDAAFTSLMDQFSPKNLSELFGAVILGLCLFILLFGRMLSAPQITREKQTQQRDSGADPTLIVTFLAVISAVYLLYMFSQLSYFFSAFSGLLPKNYTVAQYARRGFFEMTAVCAINLLIIFLANLICRKEAGKAPLAVRLLSVFFCIFSLLLAATSLSKLFLYVQSFGMTRLRITTSVFIVFLAIVFITVIFRLFFKKVPYIKVALIAAALLIAFTAFVNVDRVIAKYNIEAYLDGTLDSIDMDTIVELESAATTPYVLKLTDDSDRDVARRAKALLTWQADELFEVKGGKIISSRSELRDWNLCTASAEKLLEEHFSEYYITTGSERHWFWD